MPLFFGDFLASTATWDGEERALYLLLLGYQWSSGPLPVELQRLARTAGYDIKVFARLWKTVGPKFKRTTAGLVNVRLEEHRVKAEKITATNRDRAKHAAEQRWITAQSNAQSKSNGCSKHAPSNPLSIAAANARSITPDARSIAASDAIQSNPIKEEESEPSQREERRVLG